MIRLQSHPAFAAAERRAEELRAAMRRHPSYQSRLHRAVLGEDGKGAMVRELRVLRGTTVLEFPARDRIS
ncbi:hypothetical protein AWC00_17510 [Mycobacterium conspicuum]|nr:hypothetical protein AWC00_17510 [Mycobacterium conspicuum]